MWSESTYTISPSESFVVVGRSSRGPPLSFYYCGVILLPANRPFLRDPPVNLPWAHREQGVIM